MKKTKKEVEIICDCCGDVITSKNKRCNHYSTVLPMKDNSTHILNIDVDITFYDVCQKCLTAAFHKIAEGV